MFWAHGYDKGGKVPRIKQWEQVLKTTGHMPEGLKNKPRIQRAYLYLWDLYIDIKSGCEKITYTDIIHFQQAVGSVLTPWEVSIMIEIDKKRLTNGC